MAGWRSSSSRVAIDFCIQASVNKHKLYSKSSTAMGKDKGVLLPVGLTSWQTCGLYPCLSMHCIKMHAQYPIVICLLFGRDGEVDEYELEGVVDVLVKEQFKGRQVLEYTIFAWAV